eukprot:Em0010g844a
MRFSMPGTPAELNGGRSEPSKDHMVSDRTGYTTKAPEDASAKSFAVVLGKPSYNTGLILTVRSLCSASFEMEQGRLRISSSDNLPSNPHNPISPPHSCVLTFPQPKSTVYRHLLHKHLKKCNVTKRPTLACYTKNLNSGLVDYLCSPEEMTPLLTFPAAVIETLTAKVEAAYSEHAHKIERDVRDHPILAGEIVDPKYGSSALKHLKQQASILGHLQSLGMLAPRTCFIEFGAGKDFGLRCLLSTLQPHTVTGDTGDLSDPNLPQSKRLCQQQPAPRLEAILMALCCHHRCTWASVVGRRFFEQLGFTPVDFHLITHMSSWAVCGVRAEDIEWDHSAEGGAQNCHTHYVPHPKEEIGLKCKRLIDIARVWELRQAGLDARLVYYVDKTVSLENVLLVATIKRSEQETSV